MATWKKVIVSGSIAQLNVVSASSYSVIGSGNQVLAAPNSTFISGAFSGSFSGALTSNLINASKPNFVAYDTTTSTFSYAGTGSFTATTASYISSSGVYGPNGYNSILSSSFAATASWALNFITSSVTNATSASYAATASVALNFFTSSVTSASFATTASYVLNAGSTAQALTFGSGLSGSSATFNGGTAVTVSVSGAVSLTTNNLPKWTGTGFQNSNISDTGTAISVSSNIPVTVNSNLTVTGDLTVAGTASFQNTQNLLIGDRFAALASGSTTLTDGGIIVVSSTTANGMSGSAFFLESVSSGLYGRWAVAANVNVSSSTVTADEYAVTAKISQGSNPVDATPPTWGSSTTGMGNMWITNAGDIYIYS